MKFNFLSTEKRQSIAKVFRALALIFLFVGITWFIAVGLILAITQTKWFISAGVILLCMAFICLCVAFYFQPLVKTPSVDKVLKNTK